MILRESTFLTIIAVIGPAFAQVGCVPRERIVVVREASAPDARCPVCKAEGATAQVPVAAPPASPCESDPTCGELTLKRASLLALGKGTNHPEIQGIDARLSQCKNAAPTAGDCLHVRSEYERDRAMGYGDRHPVIQALAAELALCPAQPN